LEEVTRLLQETGKPARRGFGAKKAAAKKAAPAKKAAKAPAKKAGTKTTAKKATAKRSAKKAYVSPHPEPAKPLVTPAKVMEPGKKRVVKQAKDDAPF
jgi:DNA topoisomerase-1